MRHTQPQTPRHSYHMAWTVTSPWQQISKADLTTALNQCFPPHEVPAMIEKLDRGDLLETQHAFYKSQNGK